MPQAPNLQAPNLQAPIAENLVRRLFGVFDVANEGLWYMDSAGKMTYYNNAFYQRFDIETGNSGLSDWMELVHPLDRRELSDKVDLHLATDEERVVAHYRVKTRSGAYVWIEATGVVRTEDGEEFMVGSHKDISDQKLMEEYLNRAAYFDSHTGMNNKKKLIHDLSQLEAEARYTIMHISVENIKSYINQYGDEILDAVLEHVIGSFTAFSYLPCQFYRVSSDEFVVLYEKRLTDELVGELCNDCIDRYQSLSKEDAQLYGDEMSIGVFHFTPAQHETKNILQIISRTCEYAKEKASRQWVTYDHRIQARIERYFYIEKALKKAVSEKILTVKYQPIVSTSSRKIVSFEALVRWNSEVMGEIYPDEFIPIAENKGLIFDLGNIVFEKACHFIKQYNQQNEETARVNVNVSVLQLLNGNFIPSVQDIIRQVDISPDQIVLELTETVALDDNVRAKEQLEELREVGFNIALDDFGAGYSSLSSFFNLPLNQIKIDRSMTLSAIEPGQPRDYLGFLLEMCSQKGVAVVIEGIEDQAMAESMVALGMGSFQGYLFARPMNPDDAMVCGAEVIKRIPA